MTQGEDGHKVYCPGCQTVQDVETVPHSYDEATNTCVCGAVNPAAADSVSIAGFTLSFESTIVVNMYYTLSNPSAYAEHGVLVFYNPVNTADIAKANEIHASNGQVNASGYFGATTKGIPAKELGDTRYYAVYLKLSNGSYRYTDIKTYSPKQYALSRLEKSTNQNLKALCAAMLNYGSAAQTYFNYKSYNLMNASLTAEQKALVTDYSADLFVGTVAPDSSKAGNFIKSSSGFSSRSATVSFEGAFAINFYFAPSESVDDVMTFYYWSASDYAAAATLKTSNATGKIVMQRSSDGSYWAQVTGIAAKPLDDTYYVAGVYTTNTQMRCTGIIAYSLSKYCMNNATGTSAMNQLAAATAVYGYHAKIYFGN